MDTEQPKTKVYAEFARHALTHNGFGAVRCYLYAKLFSSAPAIMVDDFIEFCKKQGLKQSTIYANINSSVELGFFTRSIRQDGKKFLAVISMDKITKISAGEYKEAFNIYLSDVNDEKTVKGWLYTYAFVGLIGNDATISRAKINEILGINERTQQNYQKMFCKYSDRRNKLNVIPNALETNIKLDTLPSHTEIAQIAGKENVFAHYDKNEQKYIVYQILPNHYVFEITEDRRAKSNYRYVKHKKSNGQSGDDNPKPPANNTPANNSNEHPSDSTKRSAGDKPADFVFPEKCIENVGNKIRIFCESEKQARKLYQTEQHLMKKLNMPDPMVFSLIRRIGLDRFLPTSKYRFSKPYGVQAWRAY